MWLIWFGLSIFAAAKVFDRLTRNYVNPYKLLMVFGKKGSGKSTLLNRWAIEHHKAGWSVFASEPMPYANVFDPRKMGSISFPPKSVIFIDEVSLLWDNRRFKDFPTEFSDWLRLQRHYQCKLIIASQSWDCDKRIRDLSDSLYLVQNVARVFTWAKRINRVVGLTEATSDGGESRIVDNLRFDSILFWPAGSRILTWIPKYAKCFDSFKSYTQLDEVKVLTYVDGKPLPHVWEFLRPFPGWIRYECHKTFILLRSRAVCTAYKVVRFPSSVYRWFKWKCPILVNLYAVRASQWLSSRRSRGT